ncbi:hypothetical protein [Algoriphagus litoralis]|uniref:hypothetical protein n=1 Tax=Algoriphagus litoralis TaxID=2202829 RepID=UPI001E64736A|nr:hypothetical protein [Algoriphagus litoralis]
MKKLPLITASLLIGSVALSSCSSNKMIASATNDNLYFMASDVKLATKYAVDNNNPESFENISQEPELIEQNFSARNVNPEYISRYQTTENSNTAGDEVVYFDEGASQQTSGNINAYDNYSVAQNGNGSSGSNINFNFGLGFGYGGMMMSPWGFYDPFWGPAWGYRPWGFRPGLSIGLGFGWGNPWVDPFWGNPYMAWGNPYWGSGFGWGRPIYAGRPIYVLPGGEYGDRRVVAGARPTRGSSMTSGGIGSSQAGLMPSTSRAQARANATTASSPSARRLVSSGNSRVASRDFGNSQNDYYNSSRSRVATTRNMNSPVTDRGTATTRSSRSAVPSARSTNAYSSNSSLRSPSRSTSPAYNGRTSSPSYNMRGTSPSYNRNSAPSYNRSSTPSYNRSASPTNRTVTPSRSNNSPSFSAPSRSSGGSSFSAPSRSSGGSSGGSVGGSRGGRGN